jgi:cyclase
MYIWKAIATLVLLIPAIVLADQELANQQKKSFNVIQYDDSSFALIGKDYGTNVGVFVGNKEVLLIDPMPGEESFEKLHLLVKDTTNMPISFVVNTHNHEDHSGGNEYFNSLGATVLNEKTAKHELGLGGEASLLSKRFGLEQVKVKSHTNQDYLFFHAKSNVIFVGDVFDNSWHPTFYAGGIDGFTRTIETILATGDDSTVIIPGHGVPANKLVVKAFYKNTIDWIGRVSTLHKTQMPVEQIMQDKKINEILQRFNTEQRQEFIPQRAFQRFIERTIEIVTSS